MSSKTDQQINQQLHQVNNECDYRKRFKPITFEDKQTNSYTNTTNNNKHETNVTQSTATATTMIRPVIIPTSPMRSPLKLNEYAALKMPSKTTMENNESMTNANKDTKTETFKMFNSDRKSVV